MQPAPAQVFQPFSADFDLHILIGRTHAYLAAVVQALPSHFDSEVYGHDKTVYWDPSSMFSPAKRAKQQEMEISFDSDEFRNATEYAIVIVRKRDKLVVATRHFEVEPHYSYGQGQGSWVAQETRAAKVYHVFQYGLEMKSDNEAKVTAGLATSLAMVMQRIYFYILQNHKAVILHARADHTDMTPEGRAHAIRSGFRAYETGKVPHPTNPNQFMPAESHPKDFYLALKDVDEYHKKQQADLYAYLSSRGKFPAVLK